MSTREAKAAYRCWDDCRPGDCPSHEATLTLQTTSMAYHFTANGIEWSCSPAELKVLVELIRAIDYDAADIIGPDQTRGEDER